MAEEATANDIVARTVQFEKEGRTWIERLETTSRGGLPEIDFVNRRTGRQEREPVKIRYADVESHALFSL